jgi:MarC family membrane protein
MLAARMEHTLASATILLLLITDPVGNIPIFVNGLKAVPDHRRKWVILREVLIAFAVLLAFMFAGQAFLRAMNLSAVSLQIGGAMVLFLIALRMVFPPPPGDDPAPDHEPLIVPLAIPALAGPSALATVLLLVSQAPERRLEWVAALSLTMIVCALVLLTADRLQRIIGARVISAFERLMGLILVSISVEMLISGLKTLAQTWPT